VSLPQRAVWIPSRAARDRQDDSDGSEREHADGAVLGPPAQDLSESSHPSYGDDVPSVELPNPLTGETVSTDQFENDRAVLMTFFYTSCPDGMCPALILRLRRAQEAAAANGYGEDVQLLAMTFDPERDTEDALRTFADQQGSISRPGTGTSSDRSGTKRRRRS